MGSGIRKLEKVVMAQWIQEMSGKDRKRAGRTMESANAQGSREAV